MIRSLVVLLVLCTFAGRAWANAAQTTFVSEGNEAGAFVARPSTLAVEHEELSFLCDERGCVFKAVYAVENPSDDREEVLGAFYGIEAEGLTITANGVDARRALTSDQVKAIDGTVAVFDSALAHDQTVARQGFFLGVDGHAHATLVFAGRMRPLISETETNPAGSYGIPPIMARHLLLGTEARLDTVDTYAYALSPLRSWAGSPKVEVTLRCPRARLWAKGQEGAWVETDDPSGFVARRTIATADASTLRFRVVKRPGTTALHGGPMVGIGGRLNGGQVRARFGYEFAVPWWVVWSGSVETNFAGTTTLAPVGEVASAGYLFIPSLGLGAGVPIQVRSGAPVEVGARVQLTASFPIISVVFPVDLFPGAAGSNVWQIGLYAQASF